MKGLIINKILLLAVIITTVLCIINVSSDRNFKFLSSSISLPIIVLSVIYIFSHLMFSSENGGYIFKMNYKYIKFENDIYGRYFTTTTNEYGRIIISLYKDRLYPLHIENYDWTENIKNDILCSLGRIRDREIRDVKNILNQNSEYNKWTGSLTPIDDREEKMSELLGK